MTLRHIKDWQPAEKAKGIPKSIREMILDRHSLTQRLKRLHHQDFFVQVLCHEWQKPLFAEQSFLQCNDQNASIREVLLFGSGKPVVFARSVLPESSLTGDNSDLLSLGDKSLGDYIFSQPELRRGPIEVAPTIAKQFNQHLRVNYNN
ncbi:MAG: chorismate--pyruvate lyase family protein, partial [Endozoicomonas sp.]